MSQKIFFGTKRGENVPKNKENVPKFYFLGQKGVKMSQKIKFCPKNPENVPKNKILSRNQEFFYFVNRMIYILNMVLILISYKIHDLLTIQQTYIRVVHP